MKDLLLFVHIVAQALDLDISRCRLAGHVKELFLNARTARFYFLVYLVAAAFVVALTPYAL